MQTNFDSSFTSDFTPHHWLDTSGKGFCSSAGHVWYYSNGQTSDKIPEGIPCSCGAMISHYDVCPTCGHERFNPRPRD